MSKYDALYHHLLGLERPRWRASFAEVEQILGCRLPNSARTYPAWWANDQHSKSRHAKAWLEAGWHTAELNLTRQTVVFCHNNLRDEPTVVTRSLKPEVKPNPTVRGDERAASQALRRHDRALEDTEHVKEVNCNVRFMWSAIGQVVLDAAGKLVFPDTTRNPGLYRFQLKQSDQESIYIGEADDIKRRLQHYRTPGPRQQTNLRLNALIRQTLKEGGQVSVAIANSASIKTTDEEKPADFSVKAQRVLLEHAAIVSEELAGTTLLNK